MVVRKKIVLVGLLSSMLVGQVKPWFGASFMPSWTSNAISYIRKNPVKTVTAVSVTAFFLYNIYNWHTQNKPISHIDEVSRDLLTFRPYEVSRDLLTFRPYQDSNYDRVKHIYKQNEANLGTMNMDNFFLSGKYQTQLCFYNGEVVGFIVFQTKQDSEVSDDDQMSSYNIETAADDTVGNIILLAVENGYRSKGIGAHIIQHAHEQMQTQGASRVYLLCYHWNHRAHMFYRKRGYTRETTGNNGHPVFSYTF